jgi:hypothetical protein
MNIFDGIEPAQKRFHSSYRERETKAGAGYSSARPI